jgi:hypothetical protein
MMPERRLVDITGCLRSSAATPGQWAGCAPPKAGRLPGGAKLVDSALDVLKPDIEVVHRPRVGG